MLPPASSAPSGPACRLTCNPRGQVAAAARGSSFTATRGRERTQQQHRDATGRAWGRCDDQRRRGRGQACGGLAVAVLGGREEKKYIKEVVEKKYDERTEEPSQSKSTAADRRGIEPILSSCRSDSSGTLPSTRERITVKAKAADPAWNMLFPEAVPRVGPWGSLRGPPGPAGRLALDDWTRLPVSLVLVRRACARASRVRFLPRALRPPTINYSL